MVMGFFKWLFGKQKNEEIIKQQRKKTKRKLSSKKTKIKNLKSKPVNLPPKDPVAQLNERINEILKKAEKLKGKARDAALEEAGNLKNYRAKYIEESNSRFMEYAQTWLENKRAKDKIQEKRKEFLGETKEGKSTFDFLCTKKTYSPNEQEVHLKVDKNSTESFYKANGYYKKLWDKTFNDSFEIAIKYHSSSSLQIFVNDEIYAHRNDLTDVFHGEGVLIKLLPFPIKFTKNENKKLDRIVGALAQDAIEVFFTDNFIEEGGRASIKPKNKYQFIEAQKKPIKKND